MEPWFYLPTFFPGKLADWRLFLVIKTCPVASFYLLLGGQEEVVSDQWVVDRKAGC